jgi:hypothetical protein
VARPAGRRASPDQVRAAIVDATVRIVGRGGVAARDPPARSRPRRASRCRRRPTTSRRRATSSTRRCASSRAARSRRPRGRRALERLDALELPDLVEAALGFLCQQLEDEDARLAARAGYHLQLEAAHRPALRGINDEWTAAAEALAAQVLRRAGSPAPETDAKLLAAAIDALRKEEIISPRPAVAERLRPVIAGCSARLIGRAYRRSSSSPTHASPRRCRWTYSAPWSVTTRNTAWSSSSPGGRRPGSRCSSRTSACERRANASGRRPLEARALPALVLGVGLGECLVGPPELGAQGRLVGLAPAARGD